MWTYFWVLCSVSFIYLSFLTLISHYLDYYSFYSKSWSWIINQSLTLFFSFNIVLVFQVFVSPYKLYNQFVDIHEIINILTTAALNLGSSWELMSWQYWVFLSISIGISLHIFSSLISFIHFMIFHIDLLHIFSRFMPKFFIWGDNINAIVFLIQISLVLCSI